MENRGILSASHYRSARLALPNEFPARDRSFITKLSEELHLDVGWDEYDQDQNLVTWRFPKLSHQVEEEKGEGEELVIEQDASASNSEWEDEASGDDDEANAAVDRVLKKYEKAPVVDLDAQGSFDERHERSVKEKMDEWKRGYYRVMNIFFSLCLEALLILFCDNRESLKSHMTILKRWAIWYIDMWRVCNGLCIITTVEWPLGDGSTTITMHLAFQV